MLVVISYPIRFGRFYIMKRNATISWTRWQIFRLFLSFKELFERVILVEVPVRSPTGWTLTTNGNNILISINRFTFLHWFQSIKRKEFQINSIQTIQTCQFFFYVRSTLNGEILWTDFCIQRNCYGASDVWKTSSTGSRTERTSSSRCDGLRPQVVMKTLRDLNGPSFSRRIIWAGFWGEWKASTMCGPEGKFFGTKSNDWWLSDYSIDFV